MKSELRKQAVKSMVLAGIVGLSISTSALWQPGAAAEVSPTPQPEETATGSLVGTVTDVNNVPVEGCVVEVAGLTATTDRAGRFVLEGVAEGAQPVSFDSSRHVRRFAFTRIVATRTSRLESILIPRRAPHVMTVGLNDPPPIAEGPLTVDFPANALVFQDRMDSLGRPILASGAVDVEITPIEPSKLKNLLAAPAELLGKGADGELTPLQSFMMMHVELSQNGEALELAPGKTATVTMKVGGPGLPAASVQEGELIPMWWLNPASRMWEEEAGVQAKAKLLGDGSVMLTTELPHFSDWNCDRTGPAVATDIGSISGYTPAQNDLLYVMQVGDAAPFFVKTASYQTETNGPWKLSTNFPQCGMAGQAADASKSAKFEVWLQPKGTGNCYKLYGKSSIGMTSVTPPDYVESTSTMPQFTAWDVCTYLRNGGAHGLEADSDIYSSNCGSKSGYCDGNVCGESKYLSTTSGSATLASFGDCKSMAKSTNGPDGAGMAGTSFASYRLKMNLSKLSTGFACQTGM